MSTICALLQDYGFCHVEHLRRLTTVNAQVLCLSEHFLILEVIVCKLAVLITFVIFHILREWLLTQRSALPCIRVVAEIIRNMLWYSKACIVCR